MDAFTAVRRGHEPPSLWRRRIAAHRNPVSIKCRLSASSSGLRRDLPVEWRRARARICSTFLVIATQGGPPPGGVRRGLLSSRGLEQPVRPAASGEKRRLRRLTMPWGVLSSRVPLTGHPVLSGAPAEGRENLEN